MLTMPTAMRKSRNLSIYPDDVFVNLQTKMGLISTGHVLPSSLRVAIGPAPNLQAHPIEPILVQGELSIA